jgi:hypothetical protein
MAEWLTDDLFVCLTDCLMVCVSGWVTHVQSVWMTAWEFVWMTDLRSACLNGLCKLLSDWLSLWMINWRTLWMTECRLNDLLTIWINVSLISHLNCWIACLMINRLSFCLNWWLTGRSSYWVSGCQTVTDRKWSTPNVTPPNPGSNVVTWRHQIPPLISETGDQAIKKQIICSNFKTVIHRPGGGGSTQLWNVSLLYRDYTGLYPRN